MNSLGKHFLLELSGCPRKLLNDADFIEQTLIDAARAAKATVVSSNFHLFNPYGVSGVVVIAESHLTIHTWPEHGYAALDIFTCGDEASPELALDHCIGEFQAEQHTYIQVRRGILGGDQKKGVCFLGIEQNEG